MKGVWLAVFGVLSVTKANAQILYIDYMRPYNNVYFQKESHMTDRYIHESVIGDSLIQGESWMKLRSCVTAQMNDSCSPTRTNVTYLRFKEVSTNGTMVPYLFSFYPPNTIDSSRVMDVDTTIIGEGRTVHFRREQSCIIDSQAYSNCYHVYSATDSSSHDTYTVEGIGLIKDQQILNSADVKNSYFYLRKLVQTATSSTKRRENLPIRINHQVFRIDGKFYPVKVNGFSSVSTYLIN